MKAKIEGKEAVDLMLNVQYFRAEREKEGRTLILLTIAGMRKRHSFTADYFSISCNTLADSSEDVYIIVDDLTAQRMHKALNKYNVT